MTISLAGKTAIVTGSGSGLGAAYAIALAGAGASVVVNDVSPDAANATVDAIRAEGGQAAAVIAAVGSTDAADRLVAEAVTRFGGLDIIVTNAGILRDKSLLKMTDEDFDSVINVHLRGTFTCARAAFAHFKENGVAGRIIAIGSPTGQRGNFGQTNYAAAKAGIVGMVRTWALEMSRAGVGVNAVIPVAATPMTRTVPYFAAAVEAEDEGRPIPPFYRSGLGFGTAEDVAGLIVFLASDDSAGITGQAIGAGGDRLQLWSHPEPVLSRTREGGWSADDIAATFAPELRAELQSRRRGVPSPSARARAHWRLMVLPTIDLDAIDALDMHVHVETDGHGATSLPTELADAASRYFTSNGITPDLATIASYYRERRMAAVVFTVDARTQLGHPPLSSLTLIQEAADHADVLIPFGSVDPRLGAEAVDSVASLVEAGARGFKFHPTLQGFDPSADEFRPLWSAIADAGLPVIVHSGQTGIGAGLPGGAGLRLRYSAPMLMDDVAAEFPHLTIVLAHPSVPWQDEAIAMATHKTNVHIDLSGWSPRYFPASTGAGGGLVPPGQDPVRIRFSPADSRAVAPRLRRARPEGHRETQDSEKQRRARSRPDIHESEPC